MSVDDNYPIHAMSVGSDGDFNPPTAIVQIVEELDLKLELEEQIGMKLEIAEDLELSLNLCEE